LLEWLRWLEWLWWLEWLQMNPHFLFNALNATLTGLPGPAKTLAPFRRAR